ncbi:MAG TPA: purine-nucleoside phosphorylase, partial [Ureibacillus sp.]|nr:purine-nucleoside phosphorylase [Ureibacillus sp.]
GFPAIANRQTVDKLVKAASSRQQQAHEGITLTLDVFYTGVVPFPHELYKQAGVLAVEMENSALFTIGAIRGVKTGAILAIDGFADADLSNEYNPHTGVVTKAIEQEALVALDALVAGE